MPKAKEDREEIRKRLAQLQAQFVLQYIEHLNCPLEQKQQLVDAVVHTILEQEKETDEAAAGN